jgi:uncharacterized membrane protein
MDRETNSEKIKRSVEVEVSCSVEQVYELWGNMQNIPRWRPLVKEVKILPGDENLSHGKFGWGAPMHFCQKFASLFQVIVNILIF